jgi:hypothetical protein
MIYYPRIALKNPQAQQIINELIITKMYELIKMQNYTPGRTEMLGDYEIKTNERGIISITLSNYAYTHPSAHGLTFIKSLTANIETGEVYELKDLFKRNSDYTQKLSKIINAQIKQRDLPLVKEFYSIKPDQDFYIADKSLVIYFQLYEITPYYVGLPMFPISVYEISDFVKEDGPLGKMMPY